MFAHPPSRAPEDESVRINSDKWEPYAFSIDGHTFGVLRGGDSIPTWIPLADVDEVLVQHGPDGAIAELELHVGDTQRIGARLRPALIETMLSRAWEAGATIIATTDTPTTETPAAPSETVPAHSSRRRQNF